MKIRKLLILACSMLALFAITGCQNNSNNQNELAEVNTQVNAEVEQSSEPTMQIVNPWKDCETIEEAEELVGFSFDSIKSAEINSIRCMTSEDFNVIEARFFDGDNEVTIRKSNSEEDNSGNYNEFSVIENIIKDNAEISIKGNENGVSLASWIRDEYAYSIQCAEETELEILQSYINVVFE